MIRAAIISLAATASPVAAESFVALAYDARSMVSGTGTGATPIAAQDAALEHCGERAGRCKLRLTRADTCVALAVDYSTGGWGSFHGTPRTLIETKVVDHCASFGNENCTLVVAQCAETIVETN